MLKAPMDLATFETNAMQVAELLKTLGNQRRLMVLCKLIENEELSVGDLAEAVNLSQSALSQHLAKMREEGLVAFRRDGQMLWYRIADSRLEALLATLYDLYCTALARPQEG
ncbi:helix-turn-helix transcriptional regulator [Sphingomonas sp. ID1715]|uniref:ArsR/SmtB family transcription factor n=1 Tax=Sphingomonas sp. ID1715 TaxID=1656898 RepID=UPI00148793B4|nr:metalloregulator ArsR/SmtB family transcription factor [Sphingomonas sp. ID1715]NNM78550.1 helix-turn-helix transcriptional regulator [Sphingomonas sp. ID1715]